jgi:hypothetical protein
MNANALAGSKNDLLTDYLTNDRRSDGRQLQFNAAAIISAPGRNRNENA